MPKALVVDDSPIDRRIAGRLLEKRGGMYTLYASDGAEALRVIARELPDVVVTDLQMPVMNGLELVREIRRSDYPVPVILMTAYGNEKIAAEALRVGAASYVPKDNLAQDLVETVEMVLVAATSAPADLDVIQGLSRDECHFSLENDPEQIHPLLTYLQETIVAVNTVDNAERMRVAMAIEEAVLNALYHGNLEVSSELRQTDDGRPFYELASRRRQEAPWKDRRIYVHARATATETVFTIRDEGKGFDPSSLPDPRDPANLERPSGRGMLLIRTFMDEVSFNETGNEITMVKRRAPSARGKRA